VCDKGETSLMGLMWEGTVERRMLLYGRRGFDAIRTGRGAMRCSCIAEACATSENYE